MASSLSKVITGTVIATFESDVDTQADLGWVVFLYDTIIDSSDVVTYIAYMQKSIDT